MQAPAPVSLRFVRAASNAITLDFVPSGGKEGIERFELQYQLASEASGAQEEAVVGAGAGVGAGASGEWSTASSTLKSTRCTKSALKPGAAYIFRARACVYPERWGAFGPPTPPPVRTLLPELPTDCSESLKVP